MTAPDIDGMSRDELLAWFEAPDVDLRPLFDRMVPSTEPVAEVPPMHLTSIRLPVELMDQVDRYATVHQMTRSEVIRDALLALLAQVNPGGSDDVIHALDVIRRALTDRAA